MSEISKVCILRASQSYDCPRILELNEVFSGKGVELNAVIAESLDIELLDDRKRLVNITINIQVKECDDFCQRCG